MHHFEPSDDLIDAVAKFVRDDGFLRHNPLDKDKAESRLLIIFDGLDELAMQGKIATEIAQRRASKGQHRASEGEHRASEGEHRASEGEHRASEGQHIINYLKEVWKIPKYTLFI